jgi:hypothetical protein
MRQPAAAKLGFYPIPTEVLTLILRHVRADPNAVILDPCCGEGKALDAIACHLNTVPARTFGIELDEGRSAVAAECMPGARILGESNYLTTAITPGCISLAYVNPPFDHELGGGRREELSFLVKTTRTIKPGGLLVFVVPQATAVKDEVCQHMDAWYDRAEIVRFPEEHRNYHECVIFGVRRRHAIDTAGGYMQGRKYESWEWPTLGVNDDANKDFSQTYHVPAGDIPRRFEKTGFTQPELIRTLSSSPLIEMAFGEPREVSTRQPGLPVRRGQVILTLVSGKLDGPVYPDGEPPHIVRGTSKKVEFTKEDEDIINKDGDVTGHKTVIAEDVVMTCRVIPNDFSAVLDFSSAGKDKPVQETVQ